ncbi:hypothetical protein [Streptomyces sp. AC495_CC817]|uniref:hypothetical protein n=1 Tax=Streptomyces sp. AC495_CC817 TaxID=2823900 RepID=UPI001C2662B7|nr:hypothetical protein [Streptomyces sp. AC495_CC817]
MDDGALGYALFVLPLWVGIGIGVLCGVIAIALVVHVVIRLGIEAAIAAVRRRREQARLGR